MTLGSSNREVSSGHSKFHLSVSPISCLSSEVLSCFVLTHLGLSSGCCALCKDFMVSLETHWVGRQEPGVTASDLAN